MDHYPTATYTFSKEELPVIKMKMLNWLRPFSIFSYFDNNRYEHAPNRFELLVGAGAHQTLRELPSASDNWWMGHLNYDYKNKLNKSLLSRHTAQTGFEDVFFYQPENLVYIPFQEDKLVVSCVKGNPQLVLQDILNQDTHFSAVVQQIDWQYTFQKEEYLKVVAALQEHIAAGDCYEINFCMEAFATATKILPEAVFYRLNQINPAPFAAFYRNEEAYLMTASPERFLHKEGSVLTAQPIKGTAARGKNAEEDELRKRELRQSEKERAENVMIVDLMRNDLAQNCTTGSISVPELFGVYTFPQVHQLISTVQGQIKEGRNLKEIMATTFPMGSMTGAPKKIVMQLIDRYEQSRRELFSGTVGYVMPGGDFDFNVIIRGLLYESKKQYLSYQTGGAITYDSKPEAEWEELRLKARALEQLFL